MVGFVCWIVWLRNKQSKFLVIRFVCPLWAGFFCNWNLFCACLSPLFFCVCLYSFEFSGSVKRVGRYLIILNNAKHVPSNLPSKGFSLKEILSKSLANTYSHRYCYKISIAKCSKVVFIIDNISISSMYLKFFLVGPNSKSRRLQSTFLFFLSILVTNIYILS